MKRIFIAIIGLFCCQCIVYAFAPKILFINADRAYMVDITVDTTLSLHDINPQNETKEALVQHKIHCDFNVMYLWKGYYMVRFVVKQNGKIAKKDLDSTNISNLFDLRTFEEPKQERDSCLTSIFNNKYYKILYCYPQTQIVSPTYLDNVWLSELALKQNDSVELYKFYDTQIQRLRRIKMSVLYYYFEQDQIPCRSYFEIKDSTALIFERYVFDHLFNNRMENEFRRTFLFPDSLPIIYEEKPNYTYNICYNTTGNSNTYVKQVYNVEGKALYVIRNKNTYPDPRNPFAQKPYNRMVYQQYDFLYIPHVMYMPLGDFKYKIKSINGQPLNQFMAGYVDDFKPTLLQSTGTERYSKIYEIADVRVQPNFPGGQDSLFSYQSRNLSYPSSAREAGVEGKVIIGYVVNKDGTISDLQVLRSLDPACDEAAVKLVKNMPKWIPGKQNDKPVRVRMIIPIVFKMDN